MRPLRWKGRFRTGDASADRRNRAFVIASTSLSMPPISVSTAGRRGNSSTGLVPRLTRSFKNTPPTATPIQEFGRRLLASLPLGPFGGNACRKCGLCDADQEQIAARLEVPPQCLIERRDP